MGVYRDVGIAKVIDVRHVEGSDLVCFFDCLQDVWAILPGHALTSAISSDAEGRW